MARTLDPIDGGNEWISRSPSHERRSGQPMTRADDSSRSARTKETSSHLAHVDQSTHKTRVTQAVDRLLSLLPRRVFHNPNQALGISIRPFVPIRRPSRACVPPLTRIPTWSRDNRFPTRQSNDPIKMKTKKKPETPARSTLSLRPPSTFHWEARARRRRAPHPLHRVSRG